ncbi:hypothetical protein Tco_0879092 [Tanacetum coccineum]
MAPGRRPTVIATRVAEALTVMHENFREGDRVKFASSTLLDGALTWWNVCVRSVTLDTAHATPWSDFKAMFIRKYCPRIEIKQIMELKSEGYKPYRLQSTFPRTHPLMP